MCKKENINLVSVTLGKHVDANRNVPALVNLKGNTGVPGCPGNSEVSVRLGGFHGISWDMFSPTGFGAPSLVRRVFVMFDFKE